MTKTYPTKGERFKMFIDSLETADPATDRNSALELMTRVMKEIEGQFDLPSHETMKVFPFDCGWENLESDPCHWDDHAGNRHRVYLHNNGFVEIYRLPLSGEPIGTNPAKTRIRQ